VSLLAAAPLPLAILDGELRLLEGNGPFAALAGLAVEALPGLPVQEALPVAPARLLDAMRGVLEGGRPHREELVAPTGSGAGAWLIDLWRAPDAGDGGARLALLVQDLRDRLHESARALAARDRAERAAERLGALNDVMAALSGTLTTAAVAEAVFQHVARDFGVRMAALFRALPDAGEVEMLHAMDFPGDGSEARREPAGRPMPSHEVVRTGHALWMGSAAEIEEAYPNYQAVRRATGMQAWAVLPLHASGEVIGTLGLAWTAPRDFDAAERAHLGALAQQAAQALERALVFEERERLLGLVGHDLRGPLTAIAASAELVRRGGTREQARKAAERILSAARRMDRITRDLVDYTEVRVGRTMGVVRRPCDLAEIASRVSEEVDLALPGHGIVVSGEGDGRGEWDAARIAQALVNLLENAVRHAPPGVPVRLRWQGRSDDVLVAVENEGTPIHPDLLGRVFEAFWRGGGPRTAEAHRGLGLGLFIVREIARAHGGTVEARSGPGEPTVFTLRLPRRRTP
jgi:signal transduction histidine kinase